MRTVHFQRPLAALSLGVAYAASSVLFRHTPEIAAVCAGLLVLAMYLAYFSNATRWISAGAAVITAVSVMGIAVSG